jgi:N-carbamoyl-L-amino-acid hydrolase
MTTTASATSRAAAVSVDGDRLWRSLMALARVGATPRGGNRRLALSALDGQGRDLVVGWMREAGLAITVDAIGNVFGVRAGRDAARRPVMTGSHLDTQPTGAASTAAMACWRGWR